MVFALGHRRIALITCPARVPPPGIVVPLVDDDGEAMTVRMARWPLPQRGQPHRVGGVGRVHHAVVILLAALAVLVHHQGTSAAIAAPPSSAAPAMHHGMAHTPHQHGLASPDASHAHSGVSSPAEGHEGGAACASGSAQHCATAIASVVPVKLTMPPGSFAERAPDSYAAVSQRVASRMPPRAPPDLSVLSRLLI
jgi:hypothetical protein